MSYLSSTSSSILNNFTSSQDYSVAQAAIANSTNQTLSGATAVAVVFGTSAVPTTGSSLSIAGNTIVVNTAGTYKVGFTLQLTPTATGIHTVSLLNGATILDSVTFTIPTANVTYQYALDKLYNLSAGSILSLTALQPSGSAVISGTSPTKAMLHVESQ
jgi:hypothetical protein